jgi:hypothetical protein
VRGDIRELYDVKPIHTLTKAQAAMIVSVEHVMKYATAGAGKIDQVLTIKLAPRDRYVEMAAKHCKLLTEVTQVMDAEKLNERREQGRQRYAKVMSDLQAESRPSGR